MGLGDDLLDNALSSVNPIKVGKQKKYLFPIESTKLIVAVEFNVFPKVPTTKLIRSLIDKAYDASQHKFDAHHDSLTACKNRKSFDKDIRAAFESMTSKISPSKPSIAGSGTKSISLVTLDIDHFKRINDSRGHDYGDLVLRGFSWLLDEFCLKATRDSEVSDYSLYRLGGEEFNILIVGENDERDVCSWVEELRGFVQEAYVPSTSQLKIMADDLGVSLNYPAEGDRRITASFGVSRFVGTALIDEISGLASRLKTQADKALYSAKNSGRNRVRFFPDIIKRSGRVIENDTAAGAIVIDIGSEVGVVKGREFFVVPERYTGEVDFVVDDGRSRRKLGNYPRIKIAKVVAFNVQPEISFCSITEKREGTQVSAGCLLESIPLGLFGGLSGLHGSGDSLGETDARNDLKERISSLPDDRFRVMAVRIESIRDVESRHGAVKANELLAGAAAAMTLVLPQPVKIAQVEVGQFGAAFCSEDGSIDQLVEKLVVNLQVVCNEIADFSVGLFDHSALDSVSDAGYSLDVSHYYDYALIAAAASEKNSSSLFGPHSPQKVLSDQSEAGAFEQVAADYKKFKEIGIVAADLDNIAGVAYFSSGNLSESSAAFRSAVEIDAEPVMRSNYGITLFLLRRYYEAYEQIRISCSDKEGLIPPDNLLALYAISAYESFKSSGEPTLVEIQRLFDLATPLSNHAFVKESRLKEAYEEFINLVG